MRKMSMDFVRAFTAVVELSPLDFQDIQCIFSHSSAVFTWTNHCVSLSQQVTEPGSSKSRISLDFQRESQPTSILLANLCSPLFHCLVVSLNRQAANIEDFITSWREKAFRETTEEILMAMKSVVTFSNMPTYSIQYLCYQIFELRLLPYTCIWINCWP